MIHSRWCKEPHSNTDIMQHTEQVSMCFNHGISITLTLWMLIIFTHSTCLHVIYGSPMEQWMLIKQCFIPSVRIHLLSVKCIVIFDNNLRFQSSHFWDPMQLLYTHSSKSHHFQMLNLILMYKTFLLCLITCCHCQVSFWFRDVCPCSTILHMKSFINK